MDEESSFRPQCSCDLFEDSTAMRAALDHADRAVQAGRKVQRTIPQEIELRHVAVHQDHRNGLLRM
jgi:tRNA threonylcarbamoyladenosine modification (KEOPS) complex Cgi121 subunit